MTHDGPAMDADVVVVGAGLAGLAAARTLVRAGLTVVVVEARDRVGGRTLSTELDGQTIDLGGQWIGDKHHKLRALADELGVATFPLERAAKQIAPGAPLDARHAAEWDRISLADWLDRHVRRTSARDMIELATQMIFAKEPRELSFLFFLLYARSSEGLRRLADIRDGAQERRFATGAQSLCTRLADALGGRIRLEHPVRAVEQTADSVTVHSARGSVRARRTILAAPPALLAKLDISPALPAERMLVHANMHPGSAIKCIASYTRPFWRETGYSGEAFSPRGLVRATFDDCSPDGTHAALVAFVVGDAARELSARTDAERRALVLGDLSRLHGPAAATPSGYIDKNWLADEWSAGCYVGTLAPGLLSQVAAALRAPAGRLHFAGTETAVHHMGYLEGALESGERAASEVIAMREARVIPGT